MAWFEFAILLALWIWEHWPHMNPNLPAEAMAPPAEILAAAKAVHAAADKWGALADTLNFWSPPVLILTCALLVISIIVVIWRRQ